MRFAASALVLGLVLVTVLSPPAGALTSAVQLDVWQAETVGVQEIGILRLSQSEEFDRYTFTLEPGDDSYVAAAYVEIRNAFGETICRGPVTHQGILNVNKQCSGLRVQRTYEVHWATDLPGTELIFSGYDTIA